MKRLLFPVLFVLLTLCVFAQTPMQDSIGWIANDDTWETSIVFHNPDYSNPATVTLRFYYITGSLFGTEEVIILPHASPAFFVDIYFLYTGAGTEFYGSCALMSDIPIKWYEFVRIRGTSTIASFFGETH